MKKFSVSFLLLFASWLAFTGSIEPIEIGIGFFVSVLIALLCKEFVFYESPLRLFNPILWLWSGVYAIVFVWCEINSHLDTAYRIITGRINPAIVAVPTSLKSDIGRTLIANSITLTPGTLTVEIDDKLYVHTLNYDPKSRIGALFEKYTKKVEK